jgi:pyruvate formate lyase activating enzyme
MHMCTNRELDGLLEYGDSGYVHSVETGGTVDGPGLRYVVFTSGCPLRCLYCHNPDGMHRKNGHVMRVEHLLDDIATYIPYLKRGSGGLTVSGGEPLVQPAFTHALFHGAKLLGLHTALDTSGFLGSRASDAMLDDIDLVLLDVKAFAPATYQRLTGVALEPTLDFARRLSDRGQPMWIRYVLVPGLTDDRVEIEGLADFAAGLDTVERVEVLPFHKMGEWKWEQLSIPYQLADTLPPTPEQVDEVRAVFRSRGLTAT